MKRSIEPSSARWIMTGRWRDPSLATYSRSKRTGQLEVELDGAALPFATEGVLDLDVDLGPVEGTPALVQLVRVPEVLHHTAERGLGAVPQCGLAHEALRAGRQEQLQSSNPNACSISSAKWMHLPTSSPT